jgi:hypothetical protein
MPGKHLFEYAVIRVVPRVEREEFLNVGVIVYCKDLRFLQTLYTVHKERLTALCGTMDCEEVEEHLRSFDKICKGSKEGGPIAQLDLASRFRWLTATRSTVVQCSRVHPGLCDDAGEVLQRLYSQLVL